MTAKFNMTRDEMIAEINGQDKLILELRATIATLDETICELVGQEQPEAADFFGEGVA